MALARESYIFHVNPGEQTIADEGYNDTRYFIFPRQYPGSRVRQKKLMARHETVNKRIRQWKVLSHDRFRHELELHRICFRSVVNITEIMIEHSMENLC